MQPAAAAVANAAMPRKLSAMCANSHAPRAPGGSTPGMRPMSVRAGRRHRGQRRGDEREAHVARGDLDEQQRGREHEPGERQRRPEPGERQLADALRVGEQSPRACARTPSASRATTPRTGAPTGRANGVAARAAAPR